VKDVLARLLSHTVLNESTGCWEKKNLTGCDKYGYWRLSVAGRKQKAHRLSFELHSGAPAPAGLCVCHRCDNPKCVNPEHLFLGTVAVNNQDKADKGRAVLPPRRRGSANPQSILTESQVVEIKRLLLDGLTLENIGARFGVHYGTIWAIKAGRIWRHIQLPQEVA